ncbi:DUF2922 domain-containing protein [Secundilactobacillus kimchicus]|uniref:DUF2922 domain-containing protein n=1 Tax=Secundilactobacillus kimchicus TaxID=528209 RepID=UPI0024A7D1CF|nr:DUF2922 domain-containing protein [Secundilactobacillus kimchicus]
MNKQVLQLRFKNINGKQHTISITNPKAGLTESTVKKVMEDIAASGLFVKDGVALYATIDGASYVDTTTAKVFEA